MSERKAEYLRKFRSEPVCFVRRRTRRRDRKPRPARIPGNALLSRLL